MIPRTRFPGALRVIVFFVSLSFAVAAFAGKSLEIEFYSASTSKPFEEVIEELEFVITQENYRLVGANRIGNAIREREDIEFPDATVIHFCNLGTARKILERAPDFVIHMPCMVAVYEHEGRVVVETRLLPEDERLGALVAEVNELVKSFVDFAVEE